MAKIMIVDDSLTERRIIRTLLQENTDHTIIAEATDGEDAIYKYKRYKPDLVTMDLNMPEMNGIEALTAIIGMDPDAKIIVVTSMSQKSLVIKALQSGAKAYVLKPLDGTKLKEKIDQIIPQEQI